MEILPKYDIANYNEGNIDQAKKDKALLNTSAKFLNDKRIELEKEWLKPFDEFKSIITETNSLIKECTSKIDSVVKESENKEKESKRKSIMSYFDNLNYTLVPIEKFFDEKWLNKTVSLKKVQEEINAKIEKFKADLLTIETSFPENTDLLKSMYLDKLDLSETLQYAAKLNKNKKKIEESTKEIEEKDAKDIAGIDPVEVENDLWISSEEPKVAEQPAEINEDAIWDDAEYFDVEKKNSIQPLMDSKISGVDYENTPVPESIETEETLTRVMKVVATKEKLIALGDWMYENEIYFEKLENETA